MGGGMTDKELLELAAKAAGVPCPQWVGTHCDKYLGSDYGFWNPLTDDSDALRLAVKLGMFEEGSSPSNELTWACATENGANKYENIRRAIVRAAAEIGKEMG